MSLDLVLLAASDWAPWAAILPATIAAIGGLVVAIRASARTDELNVKADTANEKANNASEQLKEVHVLVNSNLTALTDRLNSANDRIVLLEKTLTAMNIRYKGELGQEAAQVDPSPGPVIDKS